MLSKHEYTVASTSPHTPSGISPLDRESVYTFHSARYFTTSAADKISHKVKKIFLKKA
jgi:hypothetical protein